MTLLTHLGIKPRPKAPTTPLASINELRETPEPVTDEKPDWVPKTESPERVEVASTVIHKSQVKQEQPVHQKFMSWLLLLVALALFIVGQITHLLRDCTPGQIKGLFACSDCPEGESASNGLCRITLE